MNAPKLTIELVPQSCWYANVRSNVPKAEWDAIRRKTYRAADYKCEICGGVGPQWPVECHEIWHYDDEALIQEFVGFIALCPSCHEVKHIGLASVRGRLTEASKHLAKVNGWSDLEAGRYVAEQFTVWEKRSSEEWTLDISILENQ